MAKRSIRKKCDVSNKTTTVDSQKSFQAFQDTLHTILRLRAALNALPWPHAGSEPKSADDAVTELICVVGSNRDYYEGMVIEAGGSLPPMQVGGDLSMLKGSEWTGTTCALLPIRVGDRIHAWRDDSDTEGVVVEVASLGVFVKADEDGKVFAVVWGEVSVLSIECAVITP